MAWNESEAHPGSPVDPTLRDRQGNRRHSRHLRRREGILRRIALHDFCFVRFQPQNRDALCATFGEIKGHYGLRRKRSQTHWIFFQSPSVVVTLCYYKLPVVVTLRHHYALIYSRSVLETSDLGLVFATLRRSRPPRLCPPRLCPCATISPPSVAGSLRSACAAHRVPGIARQRCESPARHGPGLRQNVHTRGRSGLATPARSLLRCWHEARY